MGIAGKTQLKYKILDENSLHAALECLCKVFLTQEPITSHLEVSKAEFRPFAEALLKHALKQRLSWIALDESDGLHANKVVALRVVTALSDDFKPHCSYGAKMDDVLALLKSVSAPLKQSAQVTYENCIHSHMVAVDPAYQGAGIAKELLKLASVWALLHGYEYSVGEVTNRYNHQILSRIPSFEPLHSVSYKEFKIDGRAAFEKIQDHEACVLFRFKLRDIER